MRTNRHTTTDINTTDTMINNIDPTTGCHHAASHHTNGIALASERGYATVSGTSGIRFADTKANRARHLKKQHNYVHPSLISSVGEVFADLVKMGPGILAPSRYCKDRFLNVFFPDDQRMRCMGSSYVDVFTGYPDEFEGILDEMNYIVPTYMTKKAGMTVARPHLDSPSCPSARCSDNTGRSRFVVFSNANGDLDDQSSMIKRLAQRAPLALVVVGGLGRLEAWFYVSSWTLKEIDRFRITADRFGSGPGIRIACQFYALPGGRCSKTDCVNEVVYFDSNALDPRP